MVTAQAKRARKQHRKKHTAGPLSQTCPWRTTRQVAKQRSTAPKGRPHLRQAGMSQLNSAATCSLSRGLTQRGRVASQEASSGCQPSWCGSRYT
jgi:hypothetical protein